MLTKLRKWAFNICSVCEEKAVYKIKRTAYCDRHFMPAFKLNIYKTDLKIKSTPPAAPILCLYIPGHVTFFQGVNLIRGISSVGDLIANIKYDMAKAPYFNGDIKLSDIYIAKYRTDLGPSFPWSELYMLNLKGYGPVCYVNKRIDLNEKARI